MNWICTCKQDWGKREPSCSDYEQCCMRDARLSHRKSSSLRFVIKAANRRHAMSIQNTAELIIMAQQEERERCAKLAERIGSEMGGGDGEFYIARKIADAIRASDTLISARCS